MRHRPVDPVTAILTVILLLYVIDYLLKWLVVLAVIWVIAKWFEHRE